MTHPEELLAGYVDGALSAADRATVDAHLPECPKCRGEVWLASAAHTALASVPIEPAPPGIAAAVRDETRDARVRARGGTPAWYRFAGIAAAAAAVVVIAVALPRIGSGPSEPVQKASIQDAARAAAGGTELNAAIPLEVQHTNYTSKSIQDLAAPTAFASAGAQGSSTTSETPPVPASPAPKTSAAASCVARAAPDIVAGAKLQRLIEARFEKQAAYIAVLAEGPGAGQPADKLVVLAVSTTECSILSFTQTRI